MDADNAGWWEQLAASLPPKQILIPLVLVLATVAIFSSVSDFGFLRWDDDRYVTDNTYVTTGLTAENIKWAFTETGIFYWHPVTWLSHMLDVQVFGLRGGSHHAVNMVLHATNVLLLFLLLYRGTGALWRSSIVAALFAFHPLNVETVAWISERKSLLSALFSLLTIAAYGWYTAKPSVKRYSAVMALFGLALMSKPMAVTLPVLLLLLDYWPLQRRERAAALSWKKLALEKLPLLLMSAGSSAMTIIGQRSAGAFSTLGTVPLGMRVEQAFLSYTVYLRKLFWPADLAAFYPYHPRWIPVLQVALAILLLLVITAVVWRARSKRYLLAGWLFFLIALGPVSGILQVGYVVIADRFAYIPAIGIFVALIWGCAELVEAYSVRREIPALVGCAAVVLLAGSSFHYVQYWRDGVTLFKRAAAIEKTPHPMIENLIADALLASKRIDDAFQHYKQSCDLNPKQDLCHFNMAEIMFSRYDVRGALEHYMQAGTYTTDKAIAVHCLVRTGEAYIDLGDLESAQRQLTYALQLEPENPTARQLLAGLQAR